MPELKTGQKKSLGWRTHSVLRNQLVISGIALCKVSLYIPLSKELSISMKGLIKFPKWR